MRIFENALGSNMFNFLRGNITSRDMDWHFTESTAVALDQPSVHDFSFTKTVYDCESFNHIPTDALFVVCYNALLVCLDKAEVELDELYRIRIGLITNKQTEYKHMMHLDDASRNNYSVGILYLTTNKYCPTIVECGPSQVEVEHKENSFVMFDGSQYHCSTSPTQEAVRININYNFLLK